MIVNWFRGNSPGNHGFSYEILVVPIQRIHSGRRFPHSEDSRSIPRPLPDIGPRQHPRCYNKLLRVRCLSSLGSDQLLENGVFTHGSNFPGERKRGGHLEEDFPTYPLVKYCMARKNSITLDLSVTFSHEKWRFSILMLVYQWM